MQGRQNSGAGRRGRTVSIAVSLAGLLPMLGMFAALAPSARFGPPALTLTLLALALASRLGAVSLRPGIELDAAFVAALLALVLLGPVPAACIWASTELCASLVTRRRLDALLANLTSFAAATLWGSVVLSMLAGELPVEQALGPDGYLGIAAAAATMLAVNFLVGTIVIGVLRDRRPFLPALRSELLVVAPAALGMIAAGVLAAFLYLQIGVIALATFAVAASIPAAVLPRLLHRRPVAELERPEAVAVYAQALARAIGLNRAQTLVVRDGAHLIRERRQPSREGVLRGLGDTHRIELIEAVLFYGEHWDGRDGVPGAVGGEMIPLSSRILAVADAWAGLTARTSPRLTHRQAIHQLTERAGIHFDPRVVAAAELIVTREGLALDDGCACQPSLIWLPLSALGAWASRYASRSDGRVPLPEGCR